jgi:hypothetical protein
LENFNVELCAQFPSHIAVLIWYITGI